MEVIKSKFNLKQESKCCPFFYKIKTSLDWEILKDWIKDVKPKLESMRLIAKNNYNVVRNICNNMSLKEPKITNIDNLKLIEITESTMNDIVLVQVWSCKPSKINLLIEINIGDD